MGRYQKRQIPVSPCASGDRVLCALQICAHVGDSDILSGLFPLPGSDSEQVGGAGAFSAVFCQSGFFSAVPQYHGH
ncbi:hypothetical protein D3C71_1866990 [compost metagenome]